MRQNLLLFFFLSIATILLNELFKNTLNFNQLIYSSLSEKLTSDQISSIFEFQRKWNWLTYIYFPIFLSIKILEVSSVLCIVLFILNENFKFYNIINISIKAEFIFLFVPLFKISWFLFFQTDYNLEDVQYFYPLSAINIIGYKGLEAWFIYPFQVLSLFELFYIIYLSFQIGKLTNTNADYGLKIVGLSYIPSLALWVAIVMFFTLNYS